MLYSFVKGIPSFYPRSKGNSANSPGRLKHKPARNSSGLLEFRLVLSDFCTPTGIRIPVVALKGLCPDPAINKHNLDLPEITYAGSKHRRVSSPFRNVSSWCRSTILKPLKYYSFGYHTMDDKNRPHVSERPSFPQSSQTWNGCGSFWRWVQVSPRRMNRRGLPWLRQHIKAACPLRTW